MQRYYRKLLVMLLIFVSFSFAIPLSISTGLETTIGVNNVAPSLSAVSLTDTTGTPTTTIIPNETYLINFTVQDNNSIWDLNNIIIKIFYDETTTPNKTNCYKFTYTQLDNEWVSNPTGYIVSNTTPADFNLASFRFSLSFELDKDAFPSDSWHIDINVADDATNVINATIPITVSEMPVPTPTPKPHPAGGTRRSTNVVRLLTTEQGGVLLTVTVTSEDSIAELTIPKVTIAKDAVGNPLSEVRINKQHTIPSIPPGVIRGEITGIKYACNLEPDGATFSPPITLSIKFEPADFKDATPTIYMYKDERWEALKTTVIDNKAFAKVSHFTIFTLFGKRAVPTYLPTPTITPTPVPVVAPMQTFIPPPVASKLSLAHILGITTALVIIEIVGYYYYVKRRKTKSASL